MKKYILLTSLTLAAILSLTALPSLAEAARPQVEVITPLEYDFSPTVSVSGRVEEKSRAEITLPMPAVPKQLFFEVGDTVSPGDVLASLDPDAAREALLSYASRYADLLPSLSLPEELQTALTSGNAEAFLKQIPFPKALIATAGGTLTSLSLQEGVLSFPGTPAAVLSDLSELRLRLTVPENNAGVLAPGQSLLFTVSALKEGLFSGTVTQVLPTAHWKLNGLSYETVVDVFASIDDDFNVLRPGYSVRAEITAGETETLSLLPYEAILQDPDGTEYVYVFENGFAHRRNIKTGRELSTSAAVASGLSPYETVVSNGSSISKDGPVRLKKPAS